MKSRLDMMTERDRCLRELTKRDVVRDPYARALLAGAVTALDWVLDSDRQYRQRPSSFTSSEPEDG